MAAFVEEDGGVLSPLERAETREYPDRAPLAAYLQRLRYAEDGNGFAGLALHTGSNECQYLTPRPDSVVLWCKLENPAVDQRVRFEGILAESQQLLCSFDLVL